MPPAGRNYPAMRGKFHLSFKSVSPVRACVSAPHKQPLYTFSYQNPLFIFAIFPAQNLPEKGNCAHRQIWKFDVFFVKKLSLQSQRASYIYKNMYSGFKKIQPDIKQAVPVQALP